MPQAGTRRKRSKKAQEKTNIGVLIDTQLWKDFRKHCIDIDKKPGSLLSELMEDYLKRVLIRSIKT